MKSTRMRRHIRAPRSAVYRALIDPDMLIKWKIPAAMIGEVHAFDAREGGAFRISLTYVLPDRAGKTSAHTDTYHGHFARLVPDALVVEVIEFETSDPDLMGTMTITTSLTDAGAGTDLVAVHDGLPAGVSAADNELGWWMALEKLAALLEPQ